ncbi:PAQR family membrane homeostasis protein TrhA [Georgenia halophila]
MHSDDDETRDPRTFTGGLKPAMRGWIHLGTTPLALVAGLALVALSPTREARISTAVFALSAVVLFGTSAVYHRGTWSARWYGILRRADHSNIFLLIAGTYTPLAVLLLDSSTATLLLVIAWSGALLGIAGRLLWLDAPRWLYVPIYMALGWVSFWFLPTFWRTGGPLVVSLILLGGLAYTLGALAYGMRRPNPSPRRFGFHEIFHVGTVVGWACHFTAVSVASYHA